MGKKIFKFELETTDFQEVNMHLGAEILYMATQHEKPCIWALVNPKAPLIKRTFEIFGTGHTIPDEYRKYIGSYQLNNGQLVFHCFESFDKN